MASVLKVLKKTAGDAATEPLGRALTPWGMSTTITEGVRAYFAETVVERPPVSGLFIWNLFVVYLIYILGTFAALFVYGYFFQNCGWRLQVFDPRFNCGFERGFGVGDTTPWYGPGTYSVAPGVVLSYGSFDSTVLQTFSDSRSCAIVWDGTGSLTSWDPRTKSLVIGKSTRTAALSISYRGVQQPFPYLITYPTLNCSGLVLSVQVTTRVAGWTNEVTLWTLADQYLGKFFGFAQPGNAFAAANGIDWTHDAADPPTLPESTNIRFTSTFFEDGRPPNYLAFLESANRTFSTSTQEGLSNPAVSPISPGSDFTRQVVDMYRSSLASVAVGKRYQGFFSQYMKLPSVDPTLVNLTSSSKVLGDNAVLLLTTQQVWQCYVCGSRNPIDAILYALPNVDTANMIAMPIILYILATISQRGRRQTRHTETLTTSLPPTGDVRRERYGRDVDTGTDRSKDAGGSPEDDYVTRDSVDTKTDRGVEELELGRG